MENAIAKLIGLELGSDYWGLWKNHAKSRSAERGAE